MYGVKQLFLPKILDEALTILDTYEDAKPLAGGTDIIVHMRHKQVENARLISLAQLTQLKGIVMEYDGSIFIGAMSTFTEVANHPIIAQYLPMLKTAALSMGGPQVQNMATIGGNICNGAPSADSAPALFAYDATLLLESIHGRRSVPITEFYAGPGRVNKAHNEVLIGFNILPPSKAYGDCYLKFSTRKAMDLALISCAAVCAVEADGTIASASIALGVAASTPIRTPDAEAFLIGKMPTKELFTEAGILALSQASPRDSWRASKAYREQMIRVLTRDALTTAYENAGGIAL